MSLTKPVQLLEVEIAEAGVLNYLIVVKKHWPTSLCTRKVHLDQQPLCEYLLALEMTKGFEARVHYNNVELRRKSEVDNQRRGVNSCQHYKIFSYQTLPVSRIYDTKKFVLFFTLTQPTNTNKN